MQSGYLNLDSEFKSKSLPKKFNLIYKWIVEFELSLIPRS
jgi:hypothetical protein